MIDGEATAGEQAKLRSNSQWSKGYVVGLEMPPVILQARINQTFDSLDRVGQVTFDGVTAGSYLDVMPEMTVWFGTSALGHDVGMARVRKAGSSTVLFIGETSELTLVDNLYITVLDDFLPWPIPMHVDDGTFANYDNAYTNQHQVFEPVPVLGADVVAVLDPITGQVTVERDGSDSWVFDGTITGYTWSAPGAASTSGLTTATPSFTFNAEGTYHIFGVVRANNGKTKKGVRTVYVVEHPVPCRWRNAQVDLSDGGASFEVELYTDVSKALVRDRARCILWTEDWYGGVKGSIGFEAGNEHILMGGWVAGESIELDVDGGAVRFTVKGADWWMNKFTLSAPVLDFATNTPSQWSQMATMTVDKGVWHLLAIRSNITSIMDVRLTGSTDYVKKLESSAGSLWEMIRNFADRMFAIPFVDALGRFWLRVDPQMVPEVDRGAWPTVMTLTSADLENGWDVKRVTAKDTSQIDLSGMTCDASGREKSYYALSYGHVPGREGGGMQADKFVISGQAQVNQLAGLLDGWRNNEYPDVELKLPTNFRVMSLVPHQFIALSVGADENPRGVALEFNLIPRGLRFSYDEEAGCIETVLEAEAETFELNSCNGDIPGIDEDLSEPPITSTPEDPPLPPGTDTSKRPKKVLVMDHTRGLLYTENGDAEDPADIQWQFVNGGLDTDHKRNITDILVTSYGKIYLGYRNTFSPVHDELWAASSIGGIFTKLIDVEWIRATVGGLVSETPHLAAIGINTLASDQIAFYAGVVRGLPGYLDGYLFVGNSSGFAAGGTNMLDINSNNNTGFLSFGAGKWSLTAMRRSIFSQPSLWNFDMGGSQSGARIDYDTYAGASTKHRRVGSSGTFYLIYGKLWKVDSNGGSFTLMNDAAYGNPGEFYRTWFIDFDPTGRYMMAADSGGLGHLSSDYGSTWSSLGGTLPLGISTFGWALYSSQRWCAAGGAVWFSENLGTSWVDMSGNLLYICPLPNIDFIKVIE